MSFFPTVSAPDTPPESKRRKVRKGTFSCWECKRRKMRCILDPPNTVCNSCRRRASKCISQEFPEDGWVSHERTAYHSPVNHVSTCASSTTTSHGEGGAILTPIS